MKGGGVTGASSLKSRRQPGKLQSFSESRRGPILSSPLIFTISWHKAAAQYVPKLQMGMETRAKADEFQSRACDV